MRMKIGSVAIVPAIVVLALMVVRCGMDPVAGGTNSPNGVVGVICRPDQSPAVHVPVRLFGIPREAYRPTLVLDSTRTDAAGRFRFDSLSAGAYRIEASVESLAVLQDFRIDSGVNPPDLRATLSPVTEVTGVLDAPHDSATRIIVLGTPYRTVIGADGRFVLRGLPAGFHEILAVQVNEAGSAVGLWDIDTVVLAGQAGLTMDTLRPRPLGTGDVLIDDFEDGNPYPPSGGGWYSFHNKTHGGNAVVTPALTGDSLLTSPGHNGSLWCLRIRYDLGTIAPFYGGAGTPLAEWRMIRRYVDLSGARFLRFSVKGPGHSLRVIFKSHTSPAEVSLLSLPSLGDQWTTHVIDLDTVKAKLQDSDVPAADTWPLLHRSMSSLDFVCEATVPGARGELWIDDVIVTY